MPAQSKAHLWTQVGVLTACAGNGLDPVADELPENRENSFLGQLGIMHHKGHVSFSGRRNRVCFLMEE